MVYCVLISIVFERKKSKFPKKAFFKSFPTANITSIKHETYTLKFFCKCNIYCTFETFCIWWFNLLIIIATFFSSGLYFGARTVLYYLSGSHNLPFHSRFCLVLTWYSSLRLCYVCCVVLGPVVSPSMFWKKWRNGSSLKWRRHTPHCTSLPKHGVLFGESLPTSILY